MSHNLAPETLLQLVTGSLLIDKYPRTKTTQVLRIADHGLELAH